MTTLSREHMDRLIDGHFEAEAAGDIDAIVDGFVPGAQHDVVGRPGGPIYGDRQIADFYRDLLADLSNLRFQKVRRRYGENHAIDESILNATAAGSPFGIPGHGREVRVRILHVFDFSDGLILRENAWLDLAALQEQLFERAAA
jgi:uncharacterized protein